MLARGASHRKHCGTQGHRGKEDQPACVLIELRSYGHQRFILEPVGVSGSGAAGSESIAMRFSGGSSVLSGGVPLGVHSCRSSHRTLERANEAKKPRPRQNR